MHPNLVSAFSTPQDLAAHSPTRRKRIGPQLGYLYSLFFLLVIGLGAERLSCAAPQPTQSEGALTTDVGSNELLGAITSPPTAPHLKGSDAETSHRWPKRKEEQESRTDWVWIRIRP
jgi:hypothetical protein